MDEEPKPQDLKPNLLELLREAGYDAHDFLPGETLKDFIERTKP